MKLDSSSQIAARKCPFPCHFTFGRKLSQYLGGTRRRAGGQVDVSAFDIHRQPAGIGVTRIVHPELLLQLSLNAEYPDNRGIAGARAGYGDNFVPGPEANIARCYHGREIIFFECRPFPSHFTFGRENPDHRLIPAVRPGDSGDKSISVTVIPGGHRHSVSV